MEKMHLTITGVKGETVVDQDFVCLMGSVCLTDSGHHMQLYNGICGGGEKLTTLVAYVENLKRICNEIIKEAPYMRVVLEQIIAGKADEIGIFKGTTDAYL